MFSSKNIVNELNNQIYADKETIKNELTLFKDLLTSKKLKDKNIEEIIEELFNEVINEIKIFFKKYNFVPGINVSTKINNIKINYINGYTDYTKQYKLNNDTLFDIASISKTPTAILMYQLIDEKKISINDKIRTYLEEVENLPYSLTIEDLLRYRGKYITDGRIDDAKDSIDALNRIRKVILEENSINTYNYNDIVPILCGIILEKVTNKDLITLTKEKILTPLELTNTEFSNYLTTSNITGTPNIDKGLCNDPKTNILGSYSGSAGVFCNTSNIITIFEELLKGNLFTDNLSDFYTVNPYKISRGLAGQSIIPTKIQEKGYFSNLSPIMSLGEDGSTRTIGTSGKYVLQKENYYVSSAVFTNPCSSDPEIIKLYEIINEVDPGTYFKYYDNINAYRIDARKILPSSSLDNILFTLQKFNFRVSLLLSHTNNNNKQLTLNINDRRSS